MRNTCRRRRPSESLLPRVTAGKIIADALAGLFVFLFVIAVKIAAIAGIVWVAVVVLQAMGVL